MNRGLGRGKSAKASRWEQVGVLEEQQELDRVSRAKGVRRSAEWRQHLWYPKARAGAGAIQFTLTVLNHC